MLFPMLPVTLQPAVASASGFASRQHGRRWASRPRVIRPARSSTLRCFEIAGCDISNGSASSITDASPEARRDRIARRVGSASAAKVASRSAAFITIWLYTNRRRRVNLAGGRD